jgi:hypothetical protein
MIGKYRNYSYLSPDFGSKAFRIPSPINEASIRVMKSAAMVKTAIHGA